MKTTNKLWMMLLVPALALGMAACGSSDDDNDDGGGSSANWDSRLTNVIPAKYLNEMSRYITIYQGNNPPDVEGIFKMAPLSLVKDSYDATIGKQADLYIEFFSQDPINNTVRMALSQADLIGNGYGAYISGEGSNFTIFLTMTTYEGDNDEWWGKMAAVWSGTLTSTGIKNFHYGFVMLDNNDPDEKIMMKPGRWRVWKDGDGSSPYTSW